MANALVEIVGQYFATSDIGLMATWREDALLEVGRIRTVEEHILVVIGFDYDVLGGTDIFGHFRGSGTAVGSDKAAFAHEINDIADTLGGVVRNIKGIDSHTAELERNAFFEVFAGGAELEADAIVAVDTLMDELGGIDWEMNLLSEGAYGTDMVGMVVRNEHTHDLGEVQSHIAERTMDVARRDTRIDKDTSLKGTQIIAVAAATRCKASEYKIGFLHISMQRYCFFSKYARKNNVFTQKRGKEEQDAIYLQ